LASAAGIKIKSIQPWKNITSLGSLIAGVYNPQPHAAFNKHSCGCAHENMLWRSCISISSLSTVHEDTYWKDGQTDVWDSAMLSVWKVNRSNAKITHDWRR